MMLITSDILHRLKAAAEAFQVLFSGPYRTFIEKWSADRDEQAALVQKAGMAATIGTATTLRKQVML